MTRRFRAPRGSVWRVPNTVDATGATNVVAALQSFLATVPDGGTVMFQPGTYRCDTPLLVTSRNGLTLDGEGVVTITQPNPGSTNNRPVIRVTGGSGNIIRRLTVNGGYTNSGVFTDTIQHNHGIAFLGVTGGIVDRCTVTNVSGDGIYFGINGSTICQYPTLVGSTINGTGRCGIGIVACNRASVRGNDFNATGYTMIDVEPNTAADHVTNCVIDSNIMRASTHPFNFSAVAPLISTATINQITFSNNTVLGRTLKVGFAPTSSANRYTNIFVTGNTCDTQYPGPDNTGPLSFDWCDNITITGNTIPSQLNSPGAVFWQCTGISVSGNNFGSAYTPFVSNS